MNKKQKLIVAQMILLLLLTSVIVVSLVMPVEDTNDYAGSFVKINRYTESNLREIDIDIQNILLTDKPSVEQTILKLNEYKKFTEKLSEDLASLIKQTSFLIEKEKEKTNPSHIIKKADEQMIIYKSFIDGNSHIISSVIEAFNNLNNGNDNSGQNLINELFNEYESFRSQFSRLYDYFILMLPELQNELLKLGKPGIFA